MKDFKEKNQPQRPQLSGLPEQLEGTYSGPLLDVAKTDKSFFIRRDPQ
ncbi:MAG: hypothetical protein VYB35_08520 [Verrucomicrobiota bacterium]|nr:hypothetical protein [Verrucomicrobiota bacterium]